MPDEKFSIGTVPRAEAAEQAVLGALLIDERRIPEVCARLKPADFYSESNKSVFSAIYGEFLAGRVVDPVTIQARMKDDGTLTESIPQYLLDLISLTPTAENIMEYVRVVEDTALVRAVYDAGGEIRDMAADGSGGSDYILNSAEKKVFDLRRDRIDRELLPLSQTVSAVYQGIIDAKDGRGDITGIPTGFESLDTAMMGLNRTNLIIIASRPGIGKTAIALNMALHAARHMRKEDGAVAIFSLEMSREEIAMRFIAQQARVDGKRLKTGRMEPADINAIADASVLLSDLNILTNDNPSVTVADINAQCRRVKNLGLIVIDYLQLMNGLSAKNRQINYDNRQQLVSDNARNLKIMAKELNVPVLCLSQLSRETEKRTDKTPQLSDLRESGAIEQDADIVLALNRKVEERKGELKILKNRHGPTTRIKLAWNPEFFQYTVLDEDFEEDE
ncbi:MAG: replicative DNA helicase [Oscillospiraceae bacterium]|jgi:replicative DNA helicase|nr:replicative DNA helicase [Oscillospiraceae bacterium]